MHVVEILRQDMQSQVYSTDTYPPSDDFIKNPCTLPRSLTFFLGGLLLAKTKRLDETKRKCAALGNAIIAIVRTRSFLSPLIIINTCARNPPQIVIDRKIINVHAPT